MAKDPNPPPPSLARRHWLVRPIYFRDFRRRHRWLIRSVLGLPLVLVMVFVLVTNSPMTRRVVLNELAKQLGLLVDADAAYIALDGDLVLENARFRIPGVAGTPGEFLRVAHAEASVDWSGLLTGGPDVRTVRLREPTLIVSQSTTDGLLNVGALKVPAASGSTALPAIFVTRANIELGEHTGGHFTMLRRTQMDGSYRPASDGSGYAFHLYENTTRPRRPGGPPEPGFEINGDHSNNRLFVRVNNFSLDDWPSESFPSRTRGILEDLYVRGNVPRAIFNYSEEAGITAQLEMSDVAMNLPLDPAKYFATSSEGVPGPLPRFMRMHGVKGTITFARDNVSATVDGLLEDLPYHVELKYAGLTMESPFTLDFSSRNFKVQKTAGLVPYAPPKVTELLQLFSGPTAVVDTEMRIQRRALPAGGAGPIEAAGTVTLREGTAAYQKFPYAFEGLSGVFRFDNDKVEIVKVEGRSKSGAILKADGVIAPLDDTAEVRVNVDVRDAPIDDAMQAAFGPGRQDLFPTLFHTEHYQKLLDAGLIQTPDQAAAVAAALQTREHELAGTPAETAADLNAEIAALRRRLQVPVFNFRGKANVIVNVLSPRGKDSGYLVGIDIRIPEAGVVAGKLPMPIVARDVHVKVENEVGRLLSGTFTAVGGGSARAEATFRIPSGDSSSSEPDVRIAVHDVPCSPLLIHSLPGSSAAEASDAGGKVKRILRDLGITGLLSGKIDIRPRDDEPDRPIGFTADLNVTGGDIAPSPYPGAAQMLIDDVSASVQASSLGLSARVTGLPCAPGDADSRPEFSPEPVVVEITATFGDRAKGQEPSYQVHLAGPALSMAAPVEDFIGVFSPRAAAEVLRLRELYVPSGPLNVVADVGSDPNSESPRITVEMCPAGDISVGLLGDRLTVQSPAGRAVLRSFDGISLDVDAIAGPMLFAGERSGRITLDGKFPITVGPGAGVGDQLRARLTDARFECALVDRVLLNRLSPDGYAAYTARRPEGLFDASFTVSRAPATRQAGTESELRVTSVFEPRTLTLHPGDTAVVFPTLSGQIEVDGGAGILRQVRAQAPDWSLTADGAWETAIDGTVALRTQLSGSAASLTPDLHAMLPADLRAVLEQILLKVDGPLAMEDATLALSRGESAADNRTSFHGAFSFNDASLDAGVAISELNGRLDATYQHDPGDPTPRFNLDIVGGQFRVAGIWLTNGHAEVRNGVLSGEVSVPRASGECYGGRFNARAEVTRAESGPESPRRFATNIQFAGVRLNPLLNDLSDALKSPTVRDPEDAPPADAASRGDFSRGLMDAEFSMSGLVGLPDTRRGRGTVHTEGGRVVNLPFITRLIEVSNLVLPSNSRLDFARADFYLDGGLITFEDVSVYSQAVQILGYGTMTWPGQILDLRFNSRSARPIPVISAVIQGIRDELVSTHVTGKLGEQQVRLEQFPGTRRMLGRAMGATQSEQARRMSDLERRSGDLTRPVRSGAPIVPSGRAVQAEENPPPPPPER